MGVQGWEQQLHPDRAQTWVCMQGVNKAAPNMGPEGAWKAGPATHKLALQDGHSPQIAHTASPGAHSALSLSPLSASIFSLFLFP